MSHKISPLFILIVSSFSFIYSGCSVYHQKSSSLEETIESDQKVKVVFKDGRKMHFQNLVQEKEVIYGVQKVRGQEKRVIMPKEKIQEIHIKNKGASAGLSWILGVGIFTGILVIIAANISYNGLL